MAYADCDEANAAIGVAVALGGPTTNLRDVLRQIQNDLFDAGADLSTPVVDEPANIRRCGSPQPYIDRLEAWCDDYNEDLPALNSFMLPGGSPLSALLHVARTVARRAERSAWAAIDAHPDSVSVLPAKYLNRLSDLLFILSRVANPGRRRAVAARRRERGRGRRQAGQLRPCAGAPAATDAIPARTGTPSTRPGPARSRIPAGGPGVVSRSSSTTISSVMMSNSSPRGARRETISSPAGSAGGPATTAGSTAGRTPASPPR